MTPEAKIGPRRRAFQRAACLTAFLAPFVPIGGESLLRVDLSRRAVVAAGRPVYVEEFFLLLLALLVLVVLFLLAGLVLGRVWCGWACPQTVLSERVERLAGKGPPGRPIRRALRRHAASAALSLLVGANVVWYFLPPREFFPLLARGELPAAAAWAWALLAAAGYVLLAIGGRDFCRAVCPYGRLQTALAEPGTLAVGVLPAEAERCLACGACARACPLDIDVREGDRGACVACGACVDACRDVQARRGGRGVIGYSFGGGRRDGAEARTLFGLRTAVLAVAALGAGAAFAVALAGREAVSLSLRRTAAASRLLSDGRWASFYAGSAANRAASPLEVTLSARAAEGGPLELRGPGLTFRLGPGERRPLQFVLLVPSRPPHRAVVVRLLRPDGGSAAEVRLPLPHGSPEGRP